MFSSTILTPMGLISMCSCNCGHALGHGSQRQTRTGPETHQENKACSTGVWPGNHIRRVRRDCRHTCAPWETVHFHTLLPRTCSGPQEVGSVTGYSKPDASPLSSALPVWLRSQGINRRIEHKSMIEVEIKICQSLLGAVLGIVSKLSGQAL